MSIVRLLTAFLFLGLVSAHPLPSGSPSSPSGSKLGAIQRSQTPLKSSSNTTRSLNSLQALYSGNRRFQDHQPLVAEDSPPYMLLGCVDNRLSPSTIFNTSAGSVISHNNIGNQYSSQDSSADAAVAYAIESAHVQHIIVLGHYGCKGVEDAIVKPKQTSSLVKAWIKPISDLYQNSRRDEIVRFRDSRMPHRGQNHGITEAPLPTDGGFRALVEENVKRSVKGLRTQSTLTKVYQARAQAKQNVTDVFVHGFVYDEANGDVIDLRVSFGPPGLTIPRVPFKAIAAARNFHRDSEKPRKTWDFTSHSV